MLKREKRGKTKKGREEENTTEEGCDEIEVDGEHDLKGRKEVE